MSSLPVWAAAHVPDQTGRVAVVTGANSGIGFETARALALRGARVVMACRNLDKAHTAQARILAESPNAITQVLQLDLADLDSVATFVDHFTSSYDRLDALINNAGVMALPERRETTQGFEMQFGVNVLGHFALTGRLLPLALATRGSRIVNVASLAHKRGRIAFEDLQSEHGYSPMEAYSQSKLGNLVLALELQRKLNAAGETDTMSVASHPGWTQTELGEDMMNGSKLVAVVFGTLWPLVAMETWKGALPSLVAGTSSDVRPGDYIGPNGFGEQRGVPARATKTAAAENPATGKRLWAACEKLTGVTVELASAPAR
ncbi:MAG: oxidoreductase [Rubricoccaceae bacterium]